MKLDINLIKFKRLIFCLFLMVIFIKLIKFTSNDTDDFSSKAYFFLFERTSLVVSTLMASSTF